MLITPIHVTSVASLAVVQDDARLVDLVERLLDFKARGQRAGVSPGAKVPCWPGWGRKEPKYDEIDGPNAVVTMERLEQEHRHVEELIVNERQSMETTLSSVEVKYEGELAVLRAQVDAEREARVKLEEELEQRIAALESRGT